MIGADRLTWARVIGRHPDTVRINVEPAPEHRYDPLYRAEDGRKVAELWVDPTEVAGALDLRCCRGLPVFVHAPSYDAGKAVLFRLQEFEPVLACLIAGDTLVRITAEGIEQWEL